MQKIRPDMDIGKNIQSLRYKNNLTQEQVIGKDLSYRYQCIL